MLKTLFKYYFKENIRVKELMFWNLAFPIILGTLMFVSFSRLDKNDILETIPIGVESQRFKSIYEEIKTPEGVNFFEIIETEDYDTDIKSEKISGYVKGEMDLELILGNKIIPNTVLFATTNVINNKSNLVAEIFKEKRGDVNLDEIIKESSNNKDYLKSGFDLSGKLQMNQFFYTLLAMVCLGASSSGVAAVNMTQLNSGVPIAYRYNILPVPKFKILFTMLMVTLLISILQSSFVLIFIRFILGVSFGNMYPLLINSIVFSTIFGLLIGVVIGLSLNIKMEAQIGIAVGVYITSSFLAGMMSTGIRSVIANKFPLLGRINPATIIYNLFNSLYYFEDKAIYFNYFKDLIIGIGVLLVLMIILARRREYDSI